MTTAICNDLADYHWLTGDDARTLLDELAADPAPLHTAVARLRDRLSPARTHLAIEQVDLRRRAAAKFAHADRMFFTRTALEQATDQWIAHYKAARFSTRMVADLCCGIGGDLLAISERAGSSPTPNCPRAGSSPTPIVVIGVDLNPVAAHLAAANARATLNRDIDVRTNDVADFDLDCVAAWHIDPDRRPTGRRTTSLDYCQPDRATIDRLLTRAPHAALKLAPATNVPADWAERCEREWISRDRECRQQVAWHGNLAHNSGHHRATILPSACGLAPPSACGLAPRTLVGLPNKPTPIASAPNHYLFDVDPAVLAAHLTGALAAEHNLHAIGAGPTYLTGPTPITDATLACFEILDLLPFRTRRLALHLRSHHIGQLETKKRGINIDLDELRRDLNLRGDNSATLVLTRIARRPTAILAKRLGGTP